MGICCPGAPSIAVWKLLAPAPWTQSESRPPRSSAARILAAVGYTIFGTLLPDFYRGFMNAGSAIGVARARMLPWPIAIGMLSYRLLLTLAIAGRSGPLTVRAGMTTGAVVSSLVWLTADLMLFGISTVGSVIGVIIHPLLELVPATFAGGAIAAVLTAAGSKTLARTRRRRVAAHSERRWSRSPSVGYLGDAGGVCAGAVGVVGLGAGAWTGAAGRGGGAAPLTTDPGPRCPMMASAIAPSMNSTAKIVVAFDSTVALPRAPKAVWLLPPPNALAMSPPLPCCSRMTISSTKQTSTYRVVSK
jgi:hypothetical protein